MLATVLVGVLVVTAIWTALDAGRNARAGNLAVASPTSAALQRAVAGIPSSTVVYSNLARRGVLPQRSDCLPLPNTAVPPR